MNFYQQLQLNQAGSKRLIKESGIGKEKIQRTAIYIFKVLLTVSFCFLFVTLFSILFGNENSIVGVVTLLCLLVMRQADFGIDAKHSLAVLAIIFGIFAVGPHISSTLSPLGAFAVNLLCIFGIVLVSCHNLIMSNHSTFVLCYLLLQGYDVSGEAFHMRLLGLLLGGIIVTVVFYINHKDLKCPCKFSNLFADFNIASLRSQWQIKFALTLSMLMLFLDLLGFGRIMWAGIAAMSLMSPQTSDMLARIKWRAPGNVLGCILFLGLWFILPEGIFQYIGIIGGICIGFSAKYSWQTIFNSFGALYIASGIFGVPLAIFLRIFHNAVASIFSIISDKVFHLITGALIAKTE